MKTICMAIMATLPGLALAARADAQCGAASVTIQSFGRGCNTVFGNVPALAGIWSPSGCTVSLTLTGFPGCCNTFLIGRILVVGASAASIPVPAVGQGCALLVSPDVILDTPAYLGSTWTFALPPSVPVPLTLYAQGANHYVTFGLSHDFELSNALAVTFL